MAVQQIINGRSVTLTNKQIKARIIELTGWTPEQYNKQYDIFRNRTRNYEKITGLPRGTIAANEELYRIINKDAYAQRAGGIPTYSQRERGILGTTSQRTTAKISEAQNFSAKQRILNDFSPLLNKSATAAADWGAFNAANPNATAEETRIFLDEESNKIKTLKEKEIKFNRDFYEYYGIEPESP